MPLRLLVLLLSAAPVLASDPGPGPRGRRFRPPRRPVAAALVTGLALGNALVPTSIVKSGSVRTAEAWRRRVMATQQLTLAQRAPQILVAAALCGTAAQWWLAVEEHGLAGALAQPTLVVLCAQAADSVWTAARAARRGAARVRPPGLESIQSVVSAPCCKIHCDPHRVQGHVM
jgi:hypothetical protein